MASTFINRINNEVTDKIVQEEYLKYAKTMNKYCILVLMIELPISAILSFTLLKYFDPKWKAKKTHPVTEQEEIKEPESKD